MTERAKSPEVLRKRKELKNNKEFSEAEKDGSICAREARKYSLEKKLKDNEFICLICGAELKCSGWEIEKITRVYYYLKHRKKDKLKHSHCSESSGNKSINSKLIEKSDSLRNLEEKSIINKNLSEVIVKRFNTHKNIIKKSADFKRKIKSSKKKENATSVSFIASLLELYKDTTKRNLDCVINGEKIKLSDLFVNTEQINKLPRNKFRIFFGPANAKLKTVNLLIIQPKFFVQNNIVGVKRHTDSAIPTNYYIKQDAWAPSVVNAIGENKIWYLLGKIDEFNNFQGFNGAMYKNLYVD